MAGDALKVEDATWEADVMKSPELVMVDFWAVWCGPCQMVAPIIEELSKEYAGKMKVRKLNTDENPEVAGRYQVMSIPTILFFKNGQVVEKLVGAGALGRDGQIPVEVAAAELADHLAGELEAK